MCTRSASPGLEGREALSLAGALEILDRDPVVRRQGGRPAGRLAERVLGAGGDLQPEHVDEEASRDHWRPPAGCVEVADAVGRNDVGQPPVAVHDVAHAGVVQAVDLGAEVETDLGPFL